MSKKWYGSLLFCVLKSDKVIRNFETEQPEFKSVAPCNKQESNRFSFFFDNVDGRLALISSVRQRLSIVIL